MWYHLSNNQDDISSPITKLRKPGFPYLDTNVEEPILCIAPTVWQCLSAIGTSKKQMRYIYQIHVVDPIPAEVHNDNVADVDVTHEHRITENVLRANGGRIDTTFIGTLNISKDELGYIKVAVLMKKVRPNHNQEREVFWQIANDDTWKLRDGGARIEERWNTILGAQHHRT